MKLIERSPIARFSGYDYCTTYAPSVRQEQRQNVGLANAPGDLALPLLLSSGIQAVTVESPMESSRRVSRTSGFVLIIVLMLLVVLSLLAAATATTAARAIAMAQSDADRFQSELDMASTRETLLFMLATQRLTVGGLTTSPANTIQAGTPIDGDGDDFKALPLGNEIRLDDSAYRSIGEIEFALQDDAGLVSINWAPPALNGAFLKSLGITSDKWGEYEAKRLDYEDPDDLYRLNGAERKQYAKAGRPPPANRPLSSPLELRRVLEWDKALAAKDDAHLLSTLALARSIRININTAPLNVLELLPGMTHESAQRMVKIRHTMPFLSVYQAQQAFGILVGEEGLTLFSRPSGNIILWNRHSGARQLLHWTMTPLAPTGPPWRIDYEVTLPRGAKSPPIVADTPATPLFAAKDPPR